MNIKIKMIHFKIHKNISLECINLKYTKNENKQDTFTYEIQIKIMKNKKIVECKNLQNKIIAIRENQGHGTEKYSIQKNTEHKKFKMP